MSEIVKIPASFRFGKGLLLIFCVAALMRTSAAKQPTGRSGANEPALKMSQAVVCRSIEGFERYEKLPSAAMTSDEKLLLYFRPMGYKTKPVDGVNQAHFTEDGQIRRRENKAIVRESIKFLEYKQKMPDPSKTLFLRNAISLKGLPPGEYEFVVILHDEVAKGAPAKQVVRFRVIPPQDPSKTTASSTRPIVSERQPAASTTPER